MANPTDEQLLEQAARGIEGYLSSEREQGRITGTYYENALAQTMPNLRKWLTAAVLDEISPNLRDALRRAIREARWEELVNAYSRDVAFGTGGIREKMGPNRDVVRRLQEEGIHAPIVKGPNTINDVVYLLTTAGVARFGRQRKPPLTSVVIGFDSRVRGRDFARLIAGEFLAYDYTVYLFDEACLYPSVTFAVPALKADAGVFISASHNDLRYNGYKLSCQNGSQFDPAERKELYEKFITQVSFEDIRTLDLADAPQEKLWFLGGEKAKTARRVEDGPLTGLPLADPLPDAKSQYAGREDRIIDLHSMHADHVRSFILRPELVKAAKRPLTIGYSAFNGAGRRLVPRLLTDMGFRHVHRIMKLDPLDGMFPAFCSEPGKEQQPDPGDWRAADIAVEAFREEYPQRWDDTDLIIGTDPDADRCAVIVKVPAHQQEAYPHPGTGESRDYALLWADDVWALILWYRLQFEMESFGEVRNREKKFIALSHTTSEALARIAEKYGLGVLTTWVGFAQLAAGTRALWDLSQGRDTAGITEGGQLPRYAEGRRSADDAVCNRTVHSWRDLSADRSFNVAALEQSNGFSLLGDVPPDERSLGVGGHVRDKDGAFAAVLVAEVAQYAKDQGTNLLDLLDRAIYADPDVGLYVTHYEPDPLDGEYEGLAGYSKKREILNRAEALLGQVRDGGSIALGGMPVVSGTVYRTGKYDRVNWEGFPDEGFRFYFDEAKRSHMTIRPSGTSNALRFHVQLYGGAPSRETVVDEKAQLRAATVNIVDDIRDRIGAPRSSA